LYPSSGNKKIVSENLMALEKKIKLTKSEDERADPRSIPSIFFIDGEKNINEGEAVEDNIRYEKDLDLFDCDFDDLLRQKPTPHKSSIWAIVWSDLMMTMFVLFVVMFVYLSSNKKFLSSQGLDDGVGIKGSAGEFAVTGVGSLTPDTEVTLVKNSMTKVFDVSRQTLEKEVGESFASVRLAKDETVRIVLTGDLLFDLGKTELKESAKNSLRKIGSLLTQNPYMINVSGHTDDLPIQGGDFPTNWELSLIRASKVARFLIEEMNMPKERFLVTGYAANKPIKPNTTSENRAINRRVELIIINEVP
jgi:chemotaxis protein MotB